MCKINSQLVIWARQFECTNGDSRAKLRLQRTSTGVAYIRVVQFRLRSNKANTCACVVSVERRVRFIACLKMAPHETSAWFPSCGVHSRRTILSKAPVAIIFEACKSYVDSADDASSYKLLFTMQICNTDFASYKPGSVYVGWYTVCGVNCFTCSRQLKRQRECNTGYQVKTYIGYAFSLHACIRAASKWFWDAEENIY